MRRRVTKLFVLWVACGGVLLAYNYIWRPFAVAFWFGLVLAVAGVASLLVRGWIVGLLTGAERDTNDDLPSVYSHDHGDGPGYRGMSRGRGYHGYPQ